MLILILILTLILIHSTNVNSIQEDEDCYCYYNDYDYYEECNFIDCIEDILRFFSISWKSYEWESINRGQGMTYLIKVKENIENEEYILKFFSNDSHHLISNEIDIQEQLSEANITTVNFIKNDKGKSMYENSLFLAVLSKKIQGIHHGDNKFCKSRRSNDVAFSVGRMLAHIHVAIKKKLPYQNLQSWLHPKVEIMYDDKYVRLAKKYLLDTKGLFKEQNLTVGVIHGDLHHHNILIDKKNCSILAVFDFSETTDHLLIVDIARSIDTFCTNESDHEFDRNLISKLLEGYMSIRTLNQMELKYIKKAILYYIAVFIIYYAGRLDYYFWFDKMISKASSLNTFDLF